MKEKEATGECGTTAGGLEWYHDEQIGDFSCLRIAGNTECD
jgi:hypothetical protein